MKRTVGFSFIIILGLLIACNNKKSGTAVVNESGERIVAKDSMEFTSLEAVYPHMKILTLPWVTDNETIDRKTDLQPFPKNVFDKISFSPRYYKDLRAARFADDENIKVTVVAYKDSLNRPVEELITLKPDFQFADRIQLYSIENVAGRENLQIVTESEIKDWNNIIITKKLNGTLIESLHCKIDPDGSISETRDGNTTVVAFESFDNETYYIENFVWKPLPNGGLEKSNLTKRVYKVNADGEVREIRP